MTETRQVAVLALLFLIAFMCLGILAIGFKTLDTCAADRRIVASLTDQANALRVELARVKIDQHETEVALDKEAGENVRLSDELHRRDLEAKARKGRESL